jgi:hypothetical protein
LTGQGVTAIVVRSWGSAGQSEQLVWEHLNQNWALYGPTPVSIDYTTLTDVSSFTLADLENSGASVVIVSDPAGGGQQWTPAEVAALGSYAQQGHDLVGTFHMFRWLNFDNRILAPLWGLRQDLEYDFEYPPPNAAPAAPLLVPTHCLFTSITDPLEVGGFPYVQVPMDGSWDPEDLEGASFLARSPDGRNVVTEYLGPGYRASFISYMPEFQAGLHAKSTQYVYNSIVCNALPTRSASSTWGRLKSLYR